MFCAYRVMFLPVGGVNGALGAIIGECMCVSHVHVAVLFRFVFITFPSPLSPLSPLFRLMVVAWGCHVVWCGWLGVATWSSTTGLFIAVVDRDD
jgi:hypothetical protein